jgi:hypothetical protein
MIQSSEKLASGSALVPNPYHSKTWTGAHPDETAEEALIRTRNLQEAQRISKEIDNSLLETKRALDRRKKGTKILLLGKQTLLAPERVTLMYVLAQVNRSRER